VIFPIADFRGRVIAFGGRALSPDVPAKYLNSPETELFSKRQTLYNGKDARAAARAGRTVVVVEGYLDVIAAVTAGFEGAVAPLGTALTEEHLRLLWQMSDAPVLCFDGDDAGLRAAERAVGIVLPLLAPGRTVRIATLPEGVDPDDLIRKEGRAADPTPREAVILMSLVNHPGLVENRLEALAHLDFASPAARGLLTALLDLLLAGGELDAGALRAALGARGFGPQLERMEALLARLGVWQVGAEAALLDAETGLQHALALQYKSVELNKALKAAETALDVDQTEESFERLLDIKNQITTIDGTEALIEGFGSLSGRATRSF
jgi:hypothetical protein